MSIAVSVFCPEGIVMASDSRLTSTLDGATRFIFSDNANKLFLIGNKFGVAFTGPMMDQGSKLRSHTMALLEGELKQCISVEQCAGEMQRRFPNREQCILIAGYDSLTPRVFAVSDGMLYNFSYNEANRKPTYGSVVIGTVEAAKNWKAEASGAKIIYDNMPLTDAMDFAELLVRLTIERERFGSKTGTCGGPIDILALTPDGPRWVRKKTDAL